ncbi:hypothetical protein H6P81_007148 [Aristolochia fimbriata]|uniref:DUF1995 domain-containing protein n=1 Tax=Aristolochia fimbriata TaxID=158543 RepID=A0AAV7F031_ARIFI|nr:hypothetical protein H6P81_007148 [Aristolochia fimbriata]
MASGVLKCPIPPALKDPIFSSPSSRNHFTLLDQSNLQFRTHLSVSFQNPSVRQLRIDCQYSQTEQLSESPPATREEAILQAKTSLSGSLSKPLNNPRLAGKLKKVKQPRFRVEIPVVDDSPESLTQLAFDVLTDLPIKRKGSPAAKILILWPNAVLAEQAMKATKSDGLQNSDLSVVLQKEEESATLLSSADVVVFFTPYQSQLQTMRAVANAVYPKPLVVFNPKWSYEEESEFGDQLGTFAGSFDVAYSFMGLEVRGILSRRKGVVLKKGGPESGEGWVVSVEENGELKVITRFKKRPTVGEVENVLYNVMAVNSPVTKSVKFVRDLVSNVTRKK